MKAIRCLLLGALVAVMVAGVANAQWCGPSGCGTTSVPAWNSGWGWGGGAAWGWGNAGWWGGWGCGAPVGCKPAKKSGGEKKEKKEKK